MKKSYLLLCCILFTSVTFAQSIPYNQLQKIFTTWKQGKGTTVKVINQQLKTISPKWKLSSLKPTLTESKEEKYFLWTALDTKKDTAVIALYIEEDEATVKYTVRYAFHDRLLYNSLVQALNASSYYKGHITTDTDNSKGEKSLFGHGNDNEPMDTRVDLLLSDYNLNSSESHPRLYTIDIFSRYIHK